MVSPHYAPADLHAVRPASKAQAACSPSLAACLAASCAEVTRADLPALDAFVLRGVLSAAECTALRAEASALGYSFWAGAEASAEAAAFRCCDTVEVTAPELAAALWARIAPRVQPRVTFAPGSGRGGAEDAAVERGLAGVWEACGVNEVLLFTTYGPGGHFSPHTDGNTVSGLNQRSLYSLLVYLDDCQDGGQTTLFAPPPGSEASQRLFARDASGRLRWPPEWVACAVPVVGGTALCFGQQTPHEGAPVGPGCRKVLIRTDVMYRRVPPVCEDAAGRAAYAAFLEAGAAEAGGEAMAAMQLYRRAARLSLPFAELMGLG